MAKKSTPKEPGEPPSPGEASVLRRLGDRGTTVNALVGGLRSEGYDSDESVRALRSLQRAHKVRIEEKEPYATLASFLWSPLSHWFWAALGAVVFSVALISVSSGVGIYLRYVFGSALVLFLPGYSLIEALYPKREGETQVARVGTITAELDDLTRFALSIGLSLAIVPLTGLVLNYTPFGIRLLPVALSLAGLTTALLVIALKRKHDYYKLAKGIT